MIENRTLLLVDDEPEALKGYQEFLAPAPAQGARKSSRVARSSAQATQAELTGPTGEEYHLLLAPSGEKAVEIAKQELAAGRRIAAGFFDVKLVGGMDGLQTIQAIRALDPDIHCVIVTAYHDRSVEDIHQLFGDDYKDRWDYLNKPFTRGEIIQKARQMTASWNRLRKIEAMQQQLVKSERLAAIGQVARGVGHEFGNILLRIIGKADLASMETELEKAKSHLQVIISAAERAGVIVRNLQSFTKAEPKFERKATALPLEQALSLINHELVKSSVKLNKQVPTEAPEAKIDSGALAQVFLNLFINAIHAMPSGGELGVELKVEGGAVVYKVRDTGSGIPADVLPNIFEYAFTTKGEKGSGLGLSISKDIVEKHGGTISVSSAPGKGTEFTIAIPLRS